MAVFVLVLVVTAYSVKSLVVVSRTTEYSVKYLVLGSSVIEK